MNSRDGIKKYQSEDDVECARTSAHLLPCNWTCMNNAHMRYEYCWLLAGSTEPSLSLTSRIFDFHGERRNDNICNGRRQRCWLPVKRSCVEWKMDAGLWNWAKVCTMTMCTHRIKIIIIVFVSYLSFVLSRHRVATIPLLCYLFNNLRITIKQRRTESGLIGWAHLNVCLCWRRFLHSVHTDNADKQCLYQIRYIVYAKNVYVFL